MSEKGPHTEAPMYLTVEVDQLPRDEDEDEEQMANYGKEDDLMPNRPSSSSGRVYDRTTVLIEQDPIRLDEEGEEYIHCGGDDDGVTFLTEGEGDEEGSLAYMTDPDGMSQGYVHHTISPDQIQFIINPGSTPMPRNIEGATLTLHSECPETKQREVGGSHYLTAMGFLCKTVFFMFLLHFLLPERGHRRLQQEFNSIACCCRCICFIIGALLLQQFPFQITGLCKIRLVPCVARFRNLT